MRGKQLKLFATVLFFFSLFLGACNGNTGTKAAHQTTIPQVGNVQKFDVEVYNGTQWPLFITTQGYQGGSQGVTIYPGTAAVFQVGLLPSSVTVSAYTHATPVYTYAPLTKYVGIDYSYWDQNLVFRVYDRIY
jgi:hypothetical protein